VHEENTAIALRAGCDLIVNVVIDAKRRVTWVGAGDMIAAWQQGVEFCRTVVQAQAPAPADVVVTSCAGYPLDTTWYQAVKGLVGALPIVKPGGTIILAASLSEGLGSPEFQHLMDEWSRLNFYTSVLAPRSGYSRTVTPGVCEMDEWQLVMLQKVLARCKVKIVTGGLSAEQLRRCRVEPASSVEEAVDSALQEYGAEATLAVIPKGPYVIPAVAGG
jgi:nickel-dependent lactate racemase